MSNPTPTHKHTVELCDCFTEDRRGEVNDFYKRDGDGRIRCVRCDKVPPEIRGRVPLHHRVEIKAYQHLGYGTTRRFMVIIHPEDTDD